MGEEESNWNIYVKVNGEWAEPMEFTLDRITVAQFECCGYPCHVVRVKAGHLCGYVTVGKNHSYYGVRYSELPSDFKPHVNGGITYSEKDGEGWTFGFDYAHAWNDKNYGEGYVEGSIENVVKDCASLAYALRKNRDRGYTLELDDWDYLSEKLPDAIMIKGQRYEPIF